MYTYVFMFLSGPIIGAFIGYITNYIAIKMLFRPYNEKRIFGKKVPFTPGIIPKRKPEIAKAVANAVCGTLLTKDDIEKEIFSETSKQKLKEKILGEIYKNRDLTAFDGAKNLAGEENAEKIFNGLCIKISEKLAAFVCGIDIKGLVEEKGVSIVKESLKGSLIERFASEDFIKRLLIPFGEKTEDYLKENAYNLVYPKLKQETESFKQKTIENIIADNSFGYDEISKFADACIKVLQKLVSEAAKNIDLSGIIEKKISRMNEK